MSTKAFNELKKLSKDERIVKIRESELQLFAARMDKASGLLKDTAIFWRLRKSIARMKMLTSDALKM